jgi:small subunit ribosomal protein S2
MQTNKIIEKMYEVGAHFGLRKSRRHPSMSKFVFNTKNGIDIFDLEKTEKVFSKTLEYIKSLAKENKTILFVGGKKEASALVREFANKINMPYVSGRFIGGTLTNFGEIRKRIDKYENLIKEKEVGGLEKYTKKERMLIDKDIERLENMFLGIVSMKRLPDAILLVDSRREKNALDEAKVRKIPTIGIMNSDCDFNSVSHQIVSNESQRNSIRFILEAITEAYESNKSVK